MKWIYLVALVAVSAALGGLFSYSRASSGEPDGRAAPPPRAATPSLDGAPPSLPRRALPASTPASARPAQLPAPSAEPDERSADPEAVPASSSEEVRDQLERFHETEPVDTGAAAATERLARALPALLPAGSALRSVTCRATLCRIETSHSDLHQFQQFIGRAFMDPKTTLAAGPGFAGRLGETLPGQKLVTVAYVARDGKELPSPATLAASAPPLRR
jgi:hypothetical protein